MRVLKVIIAKQKSHNKITFKQLASYCLLAQLFFLPKNVKKIKRSQNKPPFYGPVYFNFSILYYFSYNSSVGLATISPHFQICSSIQLLELTLYTLYNSLALTCQTHRTSCIMQVGYTELKGHNKYRISV